MSACLFSLCSLGWLISGVPRTHPENQIICSVLVGSTVKDWTLKSETYRILCFPKIRLSLATITVLGQVTHSGFQVKNSISCLIGAIMKESLTGILERWMHCSGAELCHHLREAVLPLVCSAPKLHQQENTTPSALGRSHLLCWEQTYSFPVKPSESS